MTPVQPTPEDAPFLLSTAPRFSYAAAKLVVEQFLLDLYRQSAVPTWVVRLFNVAGPRQRADAGVVAAFAACARSGRPLLVHGDGAQTRAFLHVADAAEAVLQVAGNDELRGRPVNVGGTVPVSIMELARRIRAGAGGGRVSRIRYTQVFGAGFHSVESRLPDVSLLRRTTGWAPRKDLEEIIQDVLAGSPTCCEPSSR